MDPLSICGRTVHQNFEGSTKREVEGVTMDHKAKTMLAHLVAESFKQIASNKSLDNSKVRVQVITNAHTIFGPNCTG